METKFTKGPWTIGTEELAGDGLKVFGASGINVGWTSAVRSRGGVVIDPHCRIEAEEAKANAALIAEAPKLYEALEKANDLLNNYIQSCGEIVLDNSIDAAEEWANNTRILSKARGEQS